MSDQLLPMSLDYFVTYVADCSERKVTEVSLRAQPNVAYLTWCPDSTCLIVTDLPALSERPGRRAALGCGG